MRVWGEFFGANGQDCCAACGGSEEGGAGTVDEGCRAAGCLEREDCGGGAGADGQGWAAWGEGLA